MTPFCAATKRRSEAEAPPESNWPLLPMRHRRWRMRKGYAHAELDEAGEWQVRAGVEEEKGSYVRTVEWWESLWDLTASLKVTWKNAAFFS